MNNSIEHTNVNLNETYSIHEIDIDVNRPKIESHFVMHKSANLEHQTTSTFPKRVMTSSISSAVTPCISNRFLVEKKEITIIKTNINITTRLSDRPKLNSKQLIKPNSSKSSSSTVLKPSISKITPTHIHTPQKLKSSITSDSESYYTPNLDINVHDKGIKSKLYCAIDSEKEKQTDSEKKLPFSPRPKFYMFAEPEDEQLSSASVAFENQEYYKMPDEKSSSANFQSFEKNEIINENSNDVYNDVNLMNSVHICEHESNDRNNNNHQAENRNLKEFLNKAAMNSPESASSTKGVEFLYLYCSSEKYTKIFEKRLIVFEKIINKGEFIDAIVLTSMPPWMKDLDLLIELYGANVLIDRRSVQCYIKFRKEILESHKDTLLQISESKFLFLKNISFNTSFPKHEFRFNFSKAD